MSQKDIFVGGFLLGTLVGGLAGGVLGALLTARQLSDSEGGEEALLNASNAEPKSTKARKRSLKATNGQGEMETARRSLEDKIAQLNEAIDDVRHQLGGIQSSKSRLEGERSSSKDL
jgi:hypothetical protein